MFQQNSSGLLAVSNVTYNVSVLPLVAVSIHVARFRAVLPYILILLSISIVIANIIVLAAFIQNRNLRTPFNVYLISLLLADLSQALFDLPLTVVSEFFPIWPLGRMFCNFNLYGKWIFAAAVRNTHSIISLNRIWALFFPLSYRQYHTRRVAVWLCVASWVYVHILLLPGLVQDDLVYRLEDGGCQVNTTAQRDWALPIQIVVYNSSVFIVGITFPLIWWKVRQRRRVMPGVAARQEYEMHIISHRDTPRLHNGRRHITSDTVPGPSQQSSSRARNDDHASDEEGQIVRPAVLVESPNQRSGRLIIAAKTSSPPSFRVLTFLVLGAVFCWSPIMVFFTMQIVYDYENYVHFIIGSLLYYFNSLLDPIFFTMALRPLRATISSFFNT